MKAFRRTGWAHWLALLVCWLLSQRALALDPEGAPITSSDYAVDITQGVVLSTSRTVGLSGAGTALAEGVEGGLSNPASVAARSVGSVDFWDYWLAFAVTYPFQNGDFYNSGSSLAEDRDDASETFLFLNTGAYLQLFSVGFGLNVELLQVGARRERGADNESSARLRLATTHVQAGSLFFDGQLALAGGLQILRPRVRATLGEMEPNDLNVNTGYGGELGVLIRPNGEQWRIGAGIYSRIEASYDGDSMSGEQPLLIPPEAIVRPWRGNVGFAYQFGKRPLNPRFTYVEEHAQKPLHELDVRAARARFEHERELSELRRSGGHDRNERETAMQRAYADQMKLLDAERAAVRKRAWRELREGMRRTWPRRYLLLATEMSFAGRVHNGVGVESFAAQTVQRSGEKISLTPRLALESEVWPTHVRVRAGSYVEASRFRESSARPHGTFGVDVRLFRWDVFRIWPEDYLWQLSTAFDFSKGYNSISASFGGWY